jgi:hypothetical protein
MHKSCDTKNTKPKCCSVTFYRTNTRIYFLSSYRNILNGATPQCHTNTCYCRSHPDASNWELVTVLTRIQEVRGSESRMEHLSLWLSPSRQTHGCCHDEVTTAYFQILSYLSIYDSDIRSCTDQLLSAPHVTSHCIILWTADCRLKFSDAVATHCLKNVISDLRSVTIYYKY